MFFKKLKGVLVPVYVGSEEPLKRLVETGFDKRNIKPSRLIESQNFLTVADFAAVCPSHYITIAKRDINSMMESSY